MLISRQKSAESLPKIGFLGVLIWVRLNHKSATFEQRLRKGKQSKQSQAGVTDDE